MLFLYLYILKPLGSKSQQVLHRIQLISGVWNGDPDRLRGGDPRSGTLTMSLPKPPSSIANGAGTQKRWGSLGPLVECFWVNIAIGP